MIADGLDMTLQEAKRKSKYNVVRQSELNRYFSQPVLCHIVFFHKNTGIIQRLPNRPTRKRRIKPSVRQARSTLYI
jgi:hypothetical protein